MRVALTQHFLAHYREPIFRLLCQQISPMPEYVIFSDTKSKENIKTIQLGNFAENPKLGSLRWEKLSNIWFGKDLLWQSGVVKLALERRFDCIILLGSMYHISTWVGAIIGRLTKKRILMWTHGYLREEKNIKGWFREKFYKLADGLLLYGNRSRQFLINRKFVSDRLYVVYNSLNYEKQCAIREQMNKEYLFALKRKLFISSDVPVLIYIGRLTRSKKLPQILEAMIILKKKGIYVNLLVIGDGPELKLMKRMVCDIELSEYVVFYGECYKEEEIGPLIMLADLCVSPAKIGLTCVHSLVYGTPVVTHDNPNLQGPEWEAIRPGINGELFKYGDCKALALTIETWLKRSIDREQVRKDCHNIVERFYNPEYQIKIINTAVFGVPASKVNSLLHKQANFSENY